MAERLIIAERLVHAGMTAAEAQRKQALFESAERALPMRESSEIHRWFVPGRIEILGKHTDYAGGRSLLCAAERGICVVARARRDSRVTVCDSSGGRIMEFELSPDAEMPATGWTVYALNVARRIARNFPGGLQGAVIALESDLPRSAGMASSSALIIAIFMALAEINSLEQRPEYKANIHSAEELAGYLGCVENGQSFGSLEGDKGVGTFGGSQDHTAILCCRPDTLSRYSFCPVQSEGTMPMPTGFGFVVATSGVQAPKTGSAQEQYNRISEAAGAILAVWSGETGGGFHTLGEAITSSPEASARIRAAIEKTAIPKFPAKMLLDRFNQFVLESEKIIPAAASALARNDFQVFGELVDQSQDAAERWLRNQVPETIELARAARRLGALAASAFGAGFGGSVWALVPSSEAAQFCERWREAFKRSLPGPTADRSQFFVTSAGPAAMKV